MFTIIHKWFNVSQSFRTNILKMNIVAYLNAEYELVRI